MGPPSERRLALSVFLWEADHKGKAEEGMKKLFALVVGLGLIVPAVPGAAADEVQQEAQKSVPQVCTKVGDVVVDFSLPSHDGSPVSLLQALGENGVILWAQSACSTCRHELEKLSMLQSAFGSVKFVVIMVDVAGKDMASKIINKFNVADVATVLYDPEFKSGEKYNVWSTPYAVIVKDGKVVARLNNLNPRNDPLVTVLKKYF